MTTHSDLVHNPLIEGAGCFRLPRVLSAIVPAKLKGIDCKQLNQNPESVSP